MKEGRSICFVYSTCIISEESHHGKRIREEKKPSNRGIITSKISPETGFIHKQRIFYYFHELMITDPSMASHEENRNAIPINRVISLFKPDMIP